MTKSLDLPQQGRSALRKVNQRVLPLLFIITFAAFLDRTNLSYASLGMMPALGLTASMMGFGAGVLFLGEALFAVPSNIAARRVGVHRWIPLLAVTWGAFAALMGTISSATEFYVLRFLLGVAEAGVMPSLVLAASIWWPESFRARAITIITAGSGVAVIVGAPLAAWLTSLHGFMGLEGWRWLFLAEGVPVVLLGVVAFWLFSAGPSQASWLDDHEKSWLVDQLSVEVAARASKNMEDRGGRIDFGLIGLSALINFCVAGVTSTTVFWLPQIGHEMLGWGLKDIGKILAPLFVIGIVGAYFVSRFSDHSAKRYSIIMVLVATSATCLALFTISPIPLVAFLLAIVSFMVVRCVGGVFMAAVSEDMQGKTAAAGFGVTMVAAGLGQFACNWSFGIVRDRAGGFNAGMIVLIALLVVTFVAAKLLELRRTRLKTVEAQQVAA